MVKKGRVFKDVTSIYYRTMEGFCDVAMLEDNPIRIPCKGITGRVDGLVATTEHYVHVFFDKKTVCELDRVWEKLICPPSPF